MTVTTTDWLSILPGLCVLASALGAIAIDLVLGGRDGRIPRLIVSAAGLIPAGVLLWQHLWTGADPLVGFGGSVVLDDLAAYVGLGIVLATGMLVALTPVDTARRHVAFGEYFALVLSSAGAMLLLVSANDFLMIFLTLEIVSLALYVLTGITRRNPRSNEAAMKYLVTGGFATGFLLLGVALVYGMTASIRLDDIGRALATGGASPVMALGVGLVLVGFAFKLGAVPFHMWVPDVYEGAPTTTTAFMSVTVKAAALGTLARILLVAFAARPELWATVLWVMAVATMFVGNLMALNQTSVKRMLAWSSVAHTGYALVALAAMSGPDGLAPEGAAAAVFYAFVYVFFTMGAFLFLVYMGHEVRGPSRVEWQDAEHIDDLAGLGERRPWAALGMTLFLISLGGLPPTAGFVGKLQVFSVAVAQGHWVLAVLGVIASLVSLVYYLRVVVVMWTQETVLADEKPSRLVGAVLCAAAVGTLLFGVRPGLLLMLAERTAQLVH